MLKALIEKRNAKIEEMQGLIKVAKTETRAFTTEESQKWDALGQEVRDLDTTIQAAQEAMNLEKRTFKEDESKEDAEIRDFAGAIRGEIEARANLTTTDNGVVIPQSIANKIITKVYDLCPIYQMATVYNVKGKLIVPVWGDGDAGENITCAYASEFTDLTSKSGKFTSIELTGFLAGALTKVSKSLINNSDFDLAAFVINEMAKAAAKFLEKEMVVGTIGKMTGIMSSTQIVTSASATAIIADELIDLQDTIPDQFQANACWIMNKSTRKAIRKLKNNDGEYLLNKDLTTPFGYSLLGKPVYVTDSADTIAAGKTVIAYGDMSGLTVKLAEQVELQVLQEVFAAQHALGVVGWLEADSKITEVQKIAVLKMKAA